MGIDLLDAIAVAITQSAEGGAAPAPRQRDSLAAARRQLSVAVRDRLCASVPPSWKQINLWTYGTATAPYVHGLDGVIGSADLITIDQIVEALPDTISRAWMSSRIEVNAVLGYRGRDGWDIDVFRQAWKKVKPTKPKLSTGALRFGK